MLSNSPSEGCWSVQRTSCAEHAGPFVSARRRTERTLQPTRNRLKCAVLRPALSLDFLAAELSR
jgi:hypothetical protein